MAPYLDAADGDHSRALELYAWSGHTAAAAFEMVGHLEVILRNALDRCLREYYSEAECGIPWFLLSTPGGEHTAHAVEAVRARLRPLGKETRHQIVAGLSFGFWEGLLGTRYEELWRASLHRAFPHGNGRRKQVATLADGIRKFRNRLAHHDSMIGLDLPFEVRRMTELASCIDPAAADWLARVGRVMDIYGRRPFADDDTVVVAARDAWPLYESVGVYVCQAGRNFRPVDRIAFYADREIKPDIPRVVERRDNVDWTPAEAARLEASADRVDRRIGRAIIESSRTHWTDGRYQVFVLTSAGHPQHRTLPSPVPNKRTGKGSGFVRGQRYTSLHALETATTTEDL